MKQRVPNTTIIGEADVPIPNLLQILFASEFFDIKDINPPKQDIGNINPLNQKPNSGLFGISSPFSVSK